VEAPLPAPITPRVALGALLWAAGWLINFHSDNILIGLRKPGQRGAAALGARGGAGSTATASAVAGSQSQKPWETAPAWPDPTDHPRPAPPPRPRRGPHPPPLLPPTAPGGYKIPRGGAFEYVSAANYFGEMLEWAGWALAAGSAPAAAFAFFTAANLAPRGWRHHQWWARLGGGGGVAVGWGWGGR
jgi:hypothetical protein